MSGSRPSRDARKRVDQSGSERWNDLSLELKKTYVLERRMCEDGSQRCSEQVYAQREVRRWLRTTITWRWWIPPVCGAARERLHDDNVDPADYVRPSLPADSRDVCSHTCTASATRTEGGSVVQESIFNRKEQLRKDYRWETSMAIDEIHAHKGLRNISMSHATAVVIYDLRLSLSPLFRYCLAISMKHSKFKIIARNFLISAALQYMRAKEEYDEIWGDAIPVSFKKAAPGIYEGYLK